MCSKLGKCLIVLLALALPACVPVGEEPPPTPSINTGLKLDMECFADSVNVINSFIEGSATDEQLKDFWNCNSAAIVEFEKNTHGNFQDRYTSRELANFVEEFFLKDGTKISDALLRQIFLLKRIFVGGAVDSITRKEMFKSIEVMKDLKIISLNLNPHMKVISFRWQADQLERSEALKTFAQAEAAIQKAAEDISPLMIQDYDLNELIVLAQEIDRFGSGSHREAFSKMANQMIPVMIATKNIIFNDWGSKVSQWREFLKFSSQFYSRYGYFDYFVKSEDVMSGDGLASFKQLVEDTLQFVDSVLDRKELNGTVALADLSRLWGAVIKAQILPKKVTVASLDLVTAAAINKIFISPALRTSGNASMALAKETIKEIRREFEIWYQVQSWLDSQYSGKAPGIGISRDDMNAAVKEAQQTQGLRELAVLVKTPEALSLDSRNRLHLGPTPLDFSRKAMNLFNVARTSVRLAMKGYAADRLRAENLSGLTMPEAENLFLDFRPLVVELDLIDPKDDKFALDRFRDANLFTPFSNGNEMLGFGEGGDLFLMLASGIKIDSSFKAVLEKKCSMDQRAPFKGDWLVDVSCAVSIYKAHLAAESTGLPEFLKYLKTLNSKNFDEVVYGLMRGAGYTGEPNGKIDLSTLGQFPQVTQYVEQVYHRFDLDRDGRFSTQEALNAYPIFRGIITKFSGLKTDRENLAVFGYMLKFGHAPTSIIDQGYFALVWANKDPAQDWGLSADRLKVIEILAFISKATASPVLFQ
jgi:hypothetical protein